MAISHVLANTKIKIVKFVLGSSKDSMTERLIARCYDLEISGWNLAKACYFFFIVNAKDHGIFYFLKWLTLLALLATLSPVN